MKDAKLNELSLAWRELYDAAVAARKNAYIPLFQLCCMVRQYAVPTEKSTVAAMWKTLPTDFVFAASVMLFSMLPAPVSAKW